LDPGSPSADAPVVREREWNARVVASTFFNVVYRGQANASPVWILVSSQVFAAEPVSTSAKSA
ncbi:hypothetical protein, partial [Methylobacterium indicum]|uniref:hypothetical protein n=1 Tax=Methylobacterium indicum TaxID=1775910 RepID=UPI001A977B5D